MRGFTMVELMVVISIIAIVATFAALNAASWLREARVGESRDLLVSDLEWIKLRSMAGVPHAVFVAGGTSTSYSLQKLTDADSNFMRDIGESTTALRYIALPQNVKISLNGGDELWFDRKGVPRTGVWGVIGRTFTLWYDANGNNAVDGGEFKREIVLSSGGRIQL